MSDNAGVLKKITFDNDPQILTGDIEVNFWPGGLVNTEPLQNVGSSTPKTEFVSGFLKGITTRNSKDGSLKRLSDSIQKTTKEDVPVIFEFANGDKWSASVFSNVDVDSFHTNTEAKSTFDVCARNGYFVPVK